MTMDLDKTAPKWDLPSETSAINLDASREPTPHIKKAMQRAAELSIVAAQQEGVDPESVPMGRFYLQALEELATSSAETPSAA